MWTSIEMLISFNRRRRHQRKIVRVCPFRSLWVGRGSLESTLVRLRLNLLPATWPAKAPLQFAQDFIRMDGMMAQQHQRVEPQISHLVDDLRLGTVLGR